MISMRPLLIWLICISLLGARLSGAHLHICLDGQEAPVSIETEMHYTSGGPDGPLMSAHESTNDIEIDLLRGLLSSDHAKGKLNLPLLAFAIASFLLVLLMRRVCLVLPPIQRRDCLPKRPPRFSPPLRGPPVFSVV